MQRNFLAENITLSLSVRDLCIIGKTLSDRYNGTTINAFINAINRAIQASTTLSEPVTVTVTIERLLEIVEILGKESEFLYNEFNKTIEQKLMANLAQLAAIDQDAVNFIATKLTERKQRIKAYQDGMIERFLLEQGLNIPLEESPEN